MDDLSGIVWLQVGQAHRVVSGRRAGLEMKDHEAEMETQAGMDFPEGLAPQVP